MFYLISRGGMAFFIFTCLCPISKEATKTVSVIVEFDKIDLMSLIIFASITNIHREYEFSTFRSIAENYSILFYD